MEFIDAYMFDDEDDDDVPERAADDYDDEEPMTPRARRLRHSTYVNASIRKRLNYSSIGANVEGSKYKTLTQRNAMHGRKRAFPNLSMDEDGYGARLHDGTEGQKLCSRFSPGPRGGTIALPFGGCIRVPPDAINKGDVVTCRIVFPHDRYKYEPILRSEDERLLSELFLLTTTGAGFQREVFVQLPRYQMIHELTIMRLLTKSLDPGAAGGGGGWQETEFMQQATESNLFSFETSEDCVAVAIACPRTERFEIPVQGCLHMGKVCRQMSIRFPKTATTTNMQCEVQIVPVNRDNMALQSPNDFEAVSDIFKMFPSVRNMEFRRTLTIKLPLPTSTKENVDQDDVSVMQLTSDGWTLLDGPFKFSKNSVTFDTKTLTQFCVSVAKSGKKQRLCETLTALQEKNNVRRGDIIPFFYASGKSWIVWFDCVPAEKVDATMTRIMNEGFQLIEPASLLPKLDFGVTSVKPGMTGAAARKPRRKQNDLELKNGTAFELEITGDIALSGDDPGRTNMLLLYHEKLSRNFRRFQVVPKFKPPDPERRLVGILKVYAPQNPSHPTDGRKCVRAYDFDIEPDLVEAYFHVEPQPPEVLEEIPEDDLEAENANQEVDGSHNRGPGKSDPEQGKRKRDPKAALESFLRLTKPISDALQMTRESKTLSGRSLKCLAGEIDKTVGLGIQLSISESALTGMAFDALASGLTLPDMTYRILLLWKRRSGDRMFRGGGGRQQVETLVRALRRLGRDDLAGVVVDRHSRNLELTSECFDCCAASPSAAIGRNGTSRDNFRADDGVRFDPKEFLLSSLSLAEAAGNIEEEEEEEGEWDEEEERGEEMLDAVDPVSERQIVLEETDDDRIHKNAGLTASSPRR